MSDLKILILILSYNEPPYSQLMKAQQETFDSIEVEDVTTVYYYGGGEEGVIKYHPDTKELVLPFTDAYYLMGGKLKMALDYIFSDSRFFSDFDIIFRTNSSSYVNKQRLKEFAATLPTEKLYAGWEIEGNAGYNVVSGAGIFLSRDTAEILRNEIDPLREREEDVLCAEILHNHGIKIIDDKSRIDYPQQKEGLKDAYHIRFKNNDRLQDAANMRLVHQKIIG